MKVTASRKLEAWNEFLSDGGSADDVATFEDGDGKAGASKVGGGGEAVMAAANDESVPFLILQRSSSCTETPSPHFSSSLSPLRLSQSNKLYSGN